MSRRKEITGRVILGLVYTAHLFIQWWINRTQGKEGLGMVSYLLGGKLRQQMTTPD